MLGSHVARHLVKQPEASLRLLIRPEGAEKAKDTLKPLLADGAEVIEGDLSDRASLDRATQGVDVIVSAVQGGPDVIIEGQLALASAGKRNGVRRIQPSDYALDLFNATPGEHMMFDLRRQADEKIADLGIEHVHVLQGAFMEMFAPGMGTFDYDKGTVSFWGEGAQPIEVTSLEDTARMIARIALDRTIPSGKFAFAGDKVSILDAARIIEEKTGHSFEPHSNGSEKDLRAAMAKAKDDPKTAVMLAYQLYMLTGQTALSDLQNDRYADMQFESFAQFAARTLPNTAA